MNDSVNEEIKIDSQIDAKLKDISDNLDLEQAPPIHQKRLVTFINHFVITTVDFVNTFSQSCSYRLFKFEEKINKLEAELCLLESKLNSMPELADEIPIVSSSPLDNKETDTISISSQPSLNSPNESEKIKLEIDPRVEKYQKMVQVGVPLEAVYLKMQVDGVEPSLLKM